MQEAAQQDILTLLWQLQAIFEKKNQMQNYYILAIKVVWKNVWFLPPALAFKTITISGFQRKLTPKQIAENFKTVGRIFTSSNEAKRSIRDFKPDICIGTGGYVSGPVIRAAIKLGVPSVIHEQNAFPGMTNKMLAKQATKVLLAVEDARAVF